MRANRIIGMQADLFGAEPVPVWSSGKPPKPRTPRERGERAAKACAAKAEAVADWDKDGARRLILARLEGCTATGEDLTDACIKAGLVPHDLRAFGAIFASLARAGKIVSVGVVERRRGNGTAGARVWRLA